MNIFNYFLHDKITVIVPCFSNDVGVVKETLQNISNQYYVNGVTVIIVNDNLTDDDINQIENTDFGNIDVKVSKDFKSIQICDTSYICIIKDTDEFRSKWSLFNLLNSDKKEKKKRKSEIV